MNTTQDLNKTESSDTWEPTQYADAITIAEHLDADTLAQLLDSIKSVTIIRPRRPRVHARIYVAHALREDMVSVGFEYCTRNGYGAENSVLVTRNNFRYGEGAVFHLYNQGRYVTLAHEAAK